MNHGMPKGQQKAIDPNQQVETNAYVPTYNLKPEFQAAVMQCIGKYPFNQIQQVMNAVKVTTVDHNQLTQIMNVLGQFPYMDVHELLANVNQFLEVVPPQMDEIEIESEDLPPEMLADVTEKEVAPAAE